MAMAPAAATSHLSPTGRDDDAASVRSLSEQESDSDDDQVLDGARDSREIAEHDRSVLEQEDEREKLLAAGDEGGGLRRIFTGGFSNASRVKVGRRQQRKDRRERRRGKKDRLLSGQGQDGELMYEMEEGGLKSDASSISDASSELDRRKLSSVLEYRNRPSRCCNLAILHVSIVLLFAILLLGAYQASRHSRSNQAVKLLSNGSSTFEPTTVLISLDGFRADFLNRGLTPTLNSFIAQGVSPQYMLPSFPSVTFPNHFTLVTGLYPESHGVVGNTFWDPEMQEEFYYTDPARSMQPKWWGGEPLWVTAEHEGVMSAIHMWPGSEAHIGDTEPTYMDKYNGTEVLPRKVDRILELLDMPGRHEPAAASGFQRPQFIAAYVPVVDADGHKYGPNSTEIRDTIKSVDDMLHAIFGGIQARNLSEVVNVVVVSDHGMATTSTDRLIQLEDLIATNLIEHTDGWPLYGLRPKKDSDIKSLYDRLAAQSAKNPNFDVYLRDENMPPRYHFSNNLRIAPLWIIPKTGWAIVTKDELDVKQAKQKHEIYHPRGLHGYDHEHPLMRAIFVARGPAFPHEPNSRVEVFQNTEVYNIICDSLAITPKPNNGTLRLPFKPVGLHSDPSTPPLDSPSDPDSDAEAVSVGVDTPSALPDRPVVNDDTEQSNKEQAAENAFLASLRAKLAAMAEWFKGLFAPSSKNADEGGDAGAEGEGDGTVNVVLVPVENIPVEGAPAT